MRPATPYPIALVGAQHFQAAIEQVGTGDAVRIWHEHDNPYDTKALIATDEDGRALGYIGRDSFLREAVHEKGKGCRARVRALEEDRRGLDYLHVVIEIEICDGREAPVERRSFSRRQAGGV